MGTKVAPGSTVDVEADKSPSDLDIASTGGAGRQSGWLTILKTWGVESRGIFPVPVEERTDPQFSKVFFIWLSCNMNILPFSLGTIGPLVNGLSFQTSAAVMVGFGLVAGIPPAFLATFGPKLGLRQMVQARYSFGYYPIIVPGILQLLGIIGYNVINVILGGQILSVVSGGGLSWNVGIVVVTVVGFVLSFFGYRVLNLYERVAWFPMLIAFLIVIVVAAKHLSSASNTPTGTPETHQSIIGLGSSIAGYIISYSPGMSDYTNYMRPEVNSWRIFILAYLGLVVPTISVAIIGAAITASMPSNPTWQEGYDMAGAGGLIAAVLAPLGGFGKFLTLLLGLSVIANLGPNLYSFCFSFPVVVPPSAHVPRYAFSLLGTVVLIPLAIAAAKRFEDTLVNLQVPRIIQNALLGLVGYWSAAFASILIIEHTYFRRSVSSAYDISVWNNPAALPLGIAALGASAFALGVVVLCMNQAWYVGVIARTTGDIGLEVGLVLAAIFYLPLRTLEKKVSSR